LTNVLRFATEANNLHCLNVDGGYQYDPRSRVNTFGAANSTAGGLGSWVNAPQAASRCCLTRLEI
jgi:hypothetical protein